MTDQPRPDERRDDDDRVADMLERTFATYAGQAPPAAGLPERVRRVQRRRVLARSGVGTGAALAVAAAIVVPMALSGGSGDPTEHSALDHFAVVGPPPADPPADGWRWESYGGVELQVPDDWDRGTTDMPWCLDREGIGKPYVGRPEGMIPLIGCPEDATLSEMGDRYVWFGSHEPVGVVTDVGGWIRDTRLIGEVVVSIKLDDAALAERIFETARLVDGVDWSGCTPDHPLAAAPGDLRPAVPWDVAAGDAVLGGSVCRYRLPDRFPYEGEVAPSDTGPALSGSRRLTSAEATAIRDAVAAAPPGTGPNDPASCMPEVARGDEAIVVRLETASGPREIFVRYASCDYHGVDDGTTVRQITPEIAANVFDATLLPDGWSGVMDDIFMPLWEAHGR